MRFISVRELRGKSAEIWRALSQEREMVVTSNGKPLAILSFVDEATLEESLAAIRQARAVAAVTAIQRRSAERDSGTISSKDVESEIGKARQKRAS